MERRAVRRPLAAAAALLVLAVTACTGDDADGGPAPDPVPTASGTTVPPVSTPVPPPTPGDAESTVPGREVERRRPVDLDEPGRAADDVVVRLTSLRAVEAEARGPGEVAGPAVAVTVRVDNRTSRAVDLGTAVVNLLGSDRRPGGLMSAPPAAPLPASVAAGAQAEGVYVFTLPLRRRDPLTVEVAVTATDPVAVFRGRGPL